MTSLRLFGASLSILCAFNFSCRAQWTPNSHFGNVPITKNCSSTEGMVAIAKLNGIFFCPSRHDEINAQVPDAAHFYLVHAYGHLAVHEMSDKLADCWAAHQLKIAPNGPHYVKQWIKHWRLYGRSNSVYKKPEERIANVRRCCACGA